MGHGFTFIFPVFEGGDFGIVSAIFLYFNSECYIVYIRAIYTRKNKTRLT